MITLKKIILFSVLLYSFNAISAQSIYVGSIQFPIKIECPPALPSILYKGREHTVDIDMQESRAPRKATYELYEDRFCQEFYVLITEYLKVPNANDFAHLETSVNHPYKLYHVQRSSKIKTESDEHVAQQPTSSSLQSLGNERIEYWEIKELDTTNPEIAIPDNTIIFFMNPTFVDLVTETWRPDDAVIRLPMIMFKNTLDEKTLHDVGAKMVCAILDFKCIHKKPTKTTTAFAHNRSVAVPNPLNRYLLNS